LDTLTIEETREFLALDALKPVDDNGNIAWTPRRRADVRTREALA
jgi:hypothetical protein